MRIPRNWPILPISVPSYLGACLAWLLRYEHGIDRQTTDSGILGVYALGEGHLINAYKHTNTHTLL